MYSIMHLISINQAEVSLVRHNWKQQTFCRQLIIHITKQALKKLITSEMKTSGSNWCPGWQSIENNVNKHQISERIYPTQKKRSSKSANHACRHLTASWRTALFGSSRAFCTERKTWKLK